MVIFHSYISLPEGNSGSMYNDPQMVGGMVDDRVYHMTQVIFRRGSSSAAFLLCILNPAKWEDLANGVL